jgi:lipase ATG15
VLSRKTLPFGWGEEEDGLRGNVFATQDNSTVILSIKGTSLWGSGNTARRDKLNDNLLFSCCCARVGWAWSGSQVCNCYTGGWTCDNTCAENALIDESLFYSVAVVSRVPCRISTSVNLTLIQNLYNNITYMYPDANIWIVGHSLGGAIASLLGATFGAPTIAFESPGERMASQRLHLPSSPSLLPITHIYHTGDPVPFGACTGIGSLCSKGGYALETRCHLGKSIVYDTVAKLGWRVNLANHPIAVIINSVLDKDWDEDQPVPGAAVEEDCVDCFKWEYI